MQLICKKKKKNLKIAIFVFDLLAGIFAKALAFVHPLPSYLCLLFFFVVLPFFLDQLIGNSLSSGQMTKGLSFLDM